MTRNLKLNDGTTLVVGMCGAAGNYLWIDVYGKRLVECALLFDNPELTTRMEYTYGEMAKETEIYVGFTSLEYLKTEDDHVKVAMRKG